jgi:diguanylate cyclase (GGDEF)-like protein
VLQTAFGRDFVCRIGGDEFAVIMVHTSSALRELVGNKIAALNKKLLAPGDGLPAFSLSVGVAFGDRPNPGEDMFKDADAALYQVKNNGRGGCAFYE